MLENILSTIEKGRKTLAIENKIFCNCIRFMSGSTFYELFPYNFHVEFYRMSCKVEIRVGKSLQQCTFVVVRVATEENLVIFVRVQVFDKERVTSYLDVEFLPMNVTFDGISTSLRVCVQLGWENVDKISINY